MSRHVARINGVFFGLLFVSLQQAPRQIVEEAQRRTTSQSQKYEGTLRVIDAMAPCRSPSLSCARASHESLLAIEPLLGPSSASVPSMDFWRCSMPAAN